MDIGCTLPHRVPWHANPRVSARKYPVRSKTIINFILMCGSIDSIEMIGCLLYRLPEKGILTFEQVYIKICS